MEKVYIDEAKICIVCFSFEGKPYALPINPDITPKMNEHSIMLTIRDPQKGLMTSKTDNEDITNILFIGGGKIEYMKNGNSFLDKIPDKECDVFINFYSKSIKGIGVKLVDRTHLIKIK